MRHNLSDVGALMKDRRSFAPEQFSTRKVHQDVVEEVLRAAIWAPTHGMTQPEIHGVPRRWAKGDSTRLAIVVHHFCGKDHVVDTKLDKLRKRMDSQLCHRHRHGARSQGAHLSRRRRMAVAAAVQNMHLMCTAYGLGAKWTTPKFMSFLKERSHGAS